MSVSFHHLSDPVGGYAADELGLLEQQIAAEAQTVDETRTFPEASIARLARAGLLSWPFSGGAHSQDASHPAELRDLLVRVGRASLPVGRLFEGHINVALLIDQFGDDDNRRLAMAEAGQGRLLGVWNAQRENGLVAERVRGGWSVSGRKIFCSGAGSIKRPIVTAFVPSANKMQMMMPEIADSQVDLSAWRAAGMRGTATGSVTFENIFVSDKEVIGGPGDYAISPYFSGGAWRVLAVQFGGLQRIVSLHAERLLERGGAGNAVTNSRFAIAAQNLELARLLVAEACQRFYDPTEQPEAIDAYVDGARTGFEELALSIIENTRRNIGLSTFIAPDPLDLVIRDLETYLRQPFLDASRDNAARWLLNRQGRYDHD